jgi:hypothetical protein
VDEPASIGTDPAAVAAIPARVTLTRAGADDIGQRQVIARVDDGDPVTLLYGDTRTLEIAPGAHRLRLHNTLVRKNLTFTVEAGGHVEFTIVNRASKLGLGFLALVGVAPVYLTVEQRARQ